MIENNVVCQNVGCFHDPRKVSNIKIGVRSMVFPLNELVIHELSLWQSGIVFLLYKRSLSSAKQTRNPVHKFVQNYLNDKVKVGNKFHGRE